MPKLTTSLQRPASYGKSRTVMKFDPFGGLLINRGNSILIVFHLYCFSKHKLSTKLIATVANLAHFVTLTFWFKKLFKFSCVYYLYIWYMIGLPLWDTVSMNLATINMLYFLKQNLSYYTTTYFHITATSPLHFLLYPKWQKRSRSTVLLSFFTWYWLKAGVEGSLLVLSLGPWLKSTARPNTLVKVVHNKFW